MFNSRMFKDSHRSHDQKQAEISRDRLFQFFFDESPLPYLEFVPVRLLADERYTGLTRQDQGDFLRFIIYLWLDRGRCVRSSLAIALYMGMKDSEWESLEKRLLKAKLIEVSPDAAYLVQPELRMQYLLNMQSNNNKKRYKKVANAAATASSSASAN